MSAPILATKLYVPPPRPGVFLRPRLIERLNEGLRRKLTLISAPAGFGKTTLLSDLGRKRDERACDLAHREALLGDVRRTGRGVPAAGRRGNPGWLHPFQERHRAVGTELRSLKEGAEDARDG